MLERHKARTTAAFDPEQPLVAGRRMTVQGHDLVAGDPLPDDLDNGVKRRLWLVRRAHYKQDFRPTPVDETAPAAPGEGAAALGDDAWMAEDAGVTVAAGDNGWYELTAPWLAEPEKAHGAEAAQEKAKELREGQGVSMTHSGGGTYEIKAAWADEPEKVKGKDAAEARVAELRKAGPSAAPVDGTDEPGTGDSTEE